MRPLARFSPLILAFVVVGASPALADDGCKAFKWDVARELAWFQAAPPSLASGGSVTTSAGAVALQLSPVESLAFPVAPEHKPTAGSFGAMISLPAITQPGTYQVTLSDEGWIDVIQNGAAVKSGAYSGAKTCPGVRKSVRFDLKPGPVMLQVSGVKGNGIDLAVEPVQ